MQLIVLRTFEADVTFERDADEFSQADALQRRLRATIIVDGEPQANFVYESWQSHWSFLGVLIGCRLGAFVMQAK